MQDDFIEWQKETLKAIELWTIRLKNEALKQKTYSGAISFLKRSKPDLSGCFKGNTDELFRETIRNIFTDAEKLVREEALKREVEHE
ncbi:hypothetical protein DS835_07025 [Lactobacillus bombicola]|uniref:Uncharacterized protein n=2 Tax=Lactobacillus bombicola TaxID=1505723 RepID=A0A396SNW6_9LACO|nr:hypothetical protein DS835_07025 [Lactobacillus bombicola]